MSPPNIIVIVVDRLGAGWLGPYGNTWVDTPALNQLASEVVLCEFTLSESHDLASVYRSYFTGLPPWCAASPTWPSLPQFARQAGLSTLLLTDAPEVATHPLAQDFQRRELLELEKPVRLARDLQATRLAHVFSTAAEAIANAEGPALVWIHAQAMNAAWDAPYELRERLADEDDPAPPRLVDPPSQQLAKGYDPDELLGIVQSYAAEVMALDECLAWLLDAINKACEPSNTLLAFTSPRGFALGEHLRVGRAGDALRGEVLQVPLLVRLPGRHGRLARLMGLHQPADLFNTLAAELGQSAENQGWGIDLRRVVDGELSGHPLAFASAGDELAIRSPDWFYRVRGVDDAAQKELYTKPDDRWEVNEIAPRAVDVVEAFDELAVWLRTQSGLPCRPNLPELPEALLAARR